MDYQAIFRPLSLTGQITNQGLRFGARKLKYRRSTEAEVDRRVQIHKKMTTERKNIYVAKILKEFYYD